MILHIRDDIATAQVRSERRCARYNGVDPHTQGTLLTLVECKQRRGNTEESEFRFPTVLQHVDHSSKRLIDGDCKARGGLRALERSECRRQSDHVPAQIEERPTTRSVGQ